MTLTPIQVLVTQACHWYWLTSLRVGEISGWVDLAAFCFVRTPEPLAALIFSRAAVIALVLSGQGDQVVTESMFVLAEPNNSPPNWISQAELHWAKKEKSCGQVVLCSLRLLLLQPVGLCLQLKQRALFCQIDFVRDNVRSSLIFSTENKNKMEVGRNKYLSNTNPLKAYNSPRTPENYLHSTKEEMKVEKMSILSMN